MFDRGRSGQYLYFSLVSAISGNIVTGASGAISGRRSLDGGALSLLSGFVTEVSSGQGQYVANLFAEDVTGNCIGYLFTASGCVPVNYSVITQQNVSGKIYAASGVNATVPIASISGTHAVVPPASLSGVNSIVPPASLSGVFASVPIASISGVNSVASVASGTLFLASGNTVGLFSGTQVLIASGTQITLASGALSGQFVTLLSGYSYTASGISVTASVGSGLFVTVPITSISGVNSVVPPASLSGVFTSVPIASISGVNAVVPIASISGVNSVATVTSGSTYLASGSIFLNTFASGVVGGGSGNLPSAWGGSGAVTVGQNLDKSGYTAGSISGTVFPASGAFVTVSIASISGTNAVVPIASISGVNSVASIVSGTVFLASGQTVQVQSGIFVTVPSSTLSGVNAIVPPANLSGVFSTVPITTISGANAVVPISSISGVNAVTTIASGTTFLASGQSVQVASGTFVTVPIASISGVNVVTASGAIYPASGTAGAIASGTVFLASGQSVAVNSGQMVALYSGQQVAVWSGTNVNVFSGTVSLTSGEVFVRIPQGVLTRDFTAFSGLVASGVSGRCVVNAERKLVNKWSLTVTSGYLTVYQENDSAVAYTQALTVASGAAPITSMDTD